MADTIKALDALLTYCRIHEARARTLRKPNWHGEALKRSLDAERHWRERAEALEEAIRAVRDQDSEEA